MISNTNKSNKPISREDVSLSDRDILKRYLGITFTSSCSIQSPLRENDHNPSFSIQEWNDRITWKDFGTGEHGNVVGLMAKLWNVSYSDALMKIKFDEGDPIPRVGLIRRYKGKVHLTSNSTMKIRVREWKDWDREFWGSFGISQKFCEACNVHPISHAFFTKPDDKGLLHTYSVPMDKYAYAYVEFKDGKESIKLYQPYSQSMKWLSKHDQSVWDLWTQAFMWADRVSSKAVILTSSRKDAMCLWENLKIPAMSLQGEGYVPKPKVMKQVLDKFEKVYIWYDNDFSHKQDNPGQDNARKLIEAYPSLINICIPDDYLSKDPSDLVKNHGVETLKRLWKTLTKDETTHISKAILTTFIMKKNTKKTNKMKQFEANVKEAINTIYNNLAESPMITGFAKYKKDYAMVNSGLALLSLGAIENQGNKTKHYYIWNENKTVDNKLISSVIDYIRVKKAPGNKKKSNIPVLQPTCITPAMPKPAVAVLTTYTDQQLWDELKSRHYMIQNNQLCKISYLQ